MFTVIWIGLEDRFHLFFSLSKTGIFVRWNKQLISVVGEKCLYLLTPLPLYSWLLTAVDIRTSQHNSIVTLIKIHTKYTWGNAPVQRYVQTRIAYWCFLTLLLLCCSGRLLSVWIWYPLSALTVQDPHASFLLFLCITFTRWHFQHLRGRLNIERTVSFFSRSTPRSWGIGAFLCHIFSMWLLGVQYICVSSSLTQKQCFTMSRNLSCRECDRLNYSKLKLLREYTRLCFGENP